MTEEKWRVSKYIFSILRSIDCQKEADLWRSKVNYYISCKNIDGVDSIIEFVEKMDTSLMSPELAIAKPALMDNFAGVTDILEEIIGKEIKVNAIKTWPMFIQYRESEEYANFIKRHKDMFEIATYTASDISCLSKNDVIKDNQALVEHLVDNKS